MKDFKFVIIILLMFFGVGIMSEIRAYDDNINNTGIMYQENDNIVLNENNTTYDYNINYNLDESYLHYFPIKKVGLVNNYDDIVKIDFNGSNQVEYINPYKEQIIKIDDINNVSNIEFELLNTNNPVVYNWNITTNPNMPFVRFYNDETKLLYDFTDINEINKIGNNLLSSRSIIINDIKNVFDLVDMFYTGFQKLFNNKVIDNILDFIQKGNILPIMPPNWFGNF